MTCAEGPAFSLPWIIPGKLTIPAEFDTEKIRTTAWSQETFGRYWTTEVCRLLLIEAFKNKSNRNLTDVCRQITRGALHGRYESSFTDSF